MIQFPTGHLNWLAINVFIAVFTSLRKVQKFFDAHLADALDYHDSSSSHLV